MICFHQIGRWGETQVKLREVASTWRDDPSRRDLIEATWKRAKEQLAVRLFDGPMCRLESLSREGDSLSITVSPTSYKIFYGTNLMNATLADVYGADALANAVGVSVGLISADGFFLLGRRNASVAYYPNRLHPFAGTLEPPDVPDAFNAARRELAEELGLSSAELTSIECVGVAEDISLRQAELIFLARCKLSRDELANRTRDDEHESAWSVRAAADEVSRILAGEENFTPIARATLRLCGRIEFGDAWFEARDV